MEKKHRISLTESEISALAHVTYHLTEYMNSDGRFDYGMAVLKKYRETNRQFERCEDKPKHIQALYSAMGKLWRKDKKINRDEK